MLIDRTQLASYLSEWTTKTSPLYHEIQVLLFSTTVFSGVYLSSFSYPERTILFISSVYTIHACLRPKIGQIFDPVKHIPLCRDIANMTLCIGTIVSSKIICHLVGEHLSFSQIIRISAVFYVTYFLIQHLFIQIKDLYYRHVSQIPTRLEFTL